MLKVRRAIAACVLAAGSAIACANQEPPMGVIAFTAGCPAAFSYWYRGGPGISRFFPAGDVERVMVRAGWRTVGYNMFQPGGPILVSDSARLNVEGETPYLMACP